AEKLKALKSGHAAAAVGTHALFQDDVAYHDLALTVIDEQHRFGVADRRRLQDKGEAVHVLAMSATPIPRTLELTVYGDLDVSRLDEKPPGRTPVATRPVPTPRGGRAGQGAGGAGPRGGFDPGRDGAEGEGRGEGRVRGGPPRRAGRRHGRR